MTINIKNDSIRIAYLFSFEPVVCWLWHYIYQKSDTCDDHGTDRQ